MNLPDGALATSRSCARWAGIFVLALSSCHCAGAEIVFLTSSSFIAVGLDSIQTKDVVFPATTQ